MQYINRLLFLLIAIPGVILTACEEADEIAEEKLGITVSSGIRPPVLSSLESSSATVAKFGVAVDTSQAQDTVYYVVLEAQTEALNGSVLLKHENVVKFLMSGNVFRPAYQPDLGEQIDYVVYALIKEGNYVSETMQLPLRRPDKSSDPVAGEPSNDDTSDDQPANNGSDSANPGNSDDTGDSDSDDTNDSADTGGDTSDNDSTNDSEDTTDNSTTGGDGSGSDGSGNGGTDSGGDNGGSDPDGGTDSGDSEPDGIQPTLADPKIEPRGTPQRFTISVAFVVAEDQKDGTIHYVAIKEKNHTGALTPQELLDHRYTKSIKMNGGDTQIVSIGADSGTKYYIYALVQVGDEVSGVVLYEGATS